MFNVHSLEVRRESWAAAAAAPLTLDILSLSHHEGYGESVQAILTPSRMGEQYGLTQTPTKRLTLNFHRESPISSWSLLYDYSRVEPEPGQA